MVQKITENRNKIAALIFIVFTTVSWLQPVDDYAENHIDDAFAQAAVAYATARGINALVSVLQTSTIEFSLGFGASITIGEMLDPINDLVERFSHVLTLALGSLAMQKVLLLITSDSVFNVLITLLAAGAIITLFRKRVHLFGWLTKGFILLCFFRFSLSIIVLMTSIVDNVFLSPDIIANTENLKAFRGELTEIKVGTMEKNNSNDDSLLGQYSDAIKDKIDDIEAIISNNVDNIVYLLVLFLLNSIAIPLFFLYLFIVFAKALWRSRWFHQYVPQEPASTTRAL